MDHPVRIDQIERAVRERQVGDRSAYEARGAILQLRSAPGELQRRGAEVDTRVSRAGSHELHAVRRNAAARFEDVLARPALELAEVEDFGLERVTLRLHLGEELRRTDGGLGGTIPGLVLRPELATGGGVGRAGHHAERSGI